MLVPLLGTTNNTLAGSVTTNQWIFPWGGSRASVLTAALGDTAGGRACMLPIGGTLSNFFAELDIAPGTGRSFTFTVTKNGTDTALTFTITEPATSGSDTTHTVSCSAADIIEVRVTSSSTTNTTPKVKSSGMQFQPTNNQETFAGCATGKNSPSNSATNYIGLWNTIANDVVWGTTIDIGHASLNSVAGTITALYIKERVAPGVGKSRQYQIYKNGSAEASSIVTISGTNTTGNVTGLSISVSAGDTLSLECIPSGTPTSAGGVCFGTAFTPTTDGETPLCGTVANTSYNSGSTERYHMTGADIFDNSDSTRQSKVPCNFILRNVRWELTNAPGSTKSFTFHSRIGGADGNLTFTIADLATTGSDLTNRDFLTQGNLINWSSVPTNAPTGGAMRWGAIADSSESFTIDTDLVKLAASLNVQQYYTGAITPALKKVTANIQLAPPIDTNPNEVWVETWEEQDP